MIYPSRTNSKLLNTQPDSVYFNYSFIRRAGYVPVLFFVVEVIISDREIFLGCFAAGFQISVVFLNRSSLRLTTGSIGSEEEFNMANGDASSSDSAPSVTHRPALQQFKRQKEQAAVEGKLHERHRVQNFTL